MVYTATLTLTGGSGASSMRVLGRGEVEYGRAGSGFLFRSELWHRTCRVRGDVVKLELFFGYFL